MSVQWMWRSAGEVRGPLSVTDLAALLQSRGISVTDEVQPVGASDWTPAADVAEAFEHDPASSADAAAALLLAADEVRLSSAFDSAVEACARSSPEADRAPRPEPVRRLSMLLRGAWSSRRLLLLAAAAAALLAFRWQASSPPDNTAVYAELVRLHASILDRASSAGQPRPADRRSVQMLIDTLESAASRMPILSLGARPGETSAVLARRELLSAARDLQQMSPSSTQWPNLDADFHRHMQSAAMLLAVDPPPQHLP